MAAPTKADEATTLAATFAVGSTVELYGIKSKPELNDSLATVQSAPAPDTGRVQVRGADGVVRALKEANLRALGAAAMPEKRGFASSLHNTFAAPASANTAHTAPVGGTVFSWGGGGAFASLVAVLGNLLSLAIVILKEAAMLLKNKEAQIGIIAVLCYIALSRPASEDPLRLVLLSAKSSVLKNTDGVARINNIDDLALDGFHNWEGRSCLSDVRHPADIRKQLKQAMVDVPADLSNKIIGGIAFEGRNDVNVLHNTRNNGGETTSYTAQWGVTYTARTMTYSTCLFINGISFKTAEVVVEEEEGEDLTEFDCNCGWFSCNKCFKKQPYKRNKMGHPKFTLSQQKKFNLFLDSMLLDQVKNTPPLPRLTYAQHVTDSIVTKVRQFAIGPPTLTLNPSAAGTLATEVDTLPAEVEVEALLSDDDFVRH